MIAAEGKRISEGIAGGANRKKSPRWLWPVLVVSDVIFLSLVAYFLMARPRPDFQFLLHFVDANFTWIAVGMGAFIAFALFFGLLKSKQPVEELILFANRMGWTLERKWGFHGGFGPVSFFGYGPYFKVMHRNLILAFCPIVDEDSRELGSRVTAFHNRPLGLGLMLKTGVGFFMEGRMPDEYKSILSKRLEIPLENVKAWAADSEKAKDLFSDPLVLNSLNLLKEELDSLNEKAESRLISRSSGFVISDRRISLLLSKNHHLNRNLVDAICDLSLALSCAETVPALPVSRAGDRIYRAVLGTLISLVVASLIWVLTDFIRDLL